MAVRSQNQVMSHDDPVSLKPSLRSTINKSLLHCCYNKSLLHCCYFPKPSHRGGGPRYPPLEWRGILERV